MTTLHANGYPISRVEHMTDGEVSNVISNLTERRDRLTGEIAEWTGQLLMRGVAHDGIVQDALFE